MNLFDLAERVAVATVSNGGIELGIAKGLTPGGRVAQGPLRQKSGIAPGYNLHVAASVGAVRVQR